MKSHYYCIENAMAPEECNQLYSMIKENANSMAKPVPAKGVTKTSEVDLCDYGKVKDLMERPRHIIHDINKNFFGFNLFPASDFDLLNLASYKEDVKAEYDWHTDNVGGEMYDIKLTTIINLSSKEYEGGELEFFINGPLQVKGFDKQGSILIFPSWIPHKVNPITKGERISLTYFVTGPNWL